MDKQLEQEYSQLQDDKKQLAKREASVRKKELEAENAFPDIFRERFQEIDTKFTERLQQCTEWERSFVARENSLAEREQQLVQREAELESNIAHTRSEKLQALEHEITSLRTARLNETEQDVAGARAQRLKAVEEEIQERYNELLRKQQLLDEREQALSAEQASVRDRELELQGKEQDLQFEAKRYEKKENQLFERQEDIEQEVQNIVKARYESFKTQEETHERELLRLREKIQNSQQLFNLYEDLKQELGDNPHKILGELSQMKMDLEKTQQELSRRPSQELGRRYRELEKEMEELTDERKRLKEQADEFSAAKEENISLKIQKDRLLSEKNHLQEHNNFLQSENERFTAAYKTEEGREKRIEIINTPFITTRLSRVTAETAPESELDWLSQITEGLNDFGFRFPNRLLYSFHTALKISEISPLTVLAGVSGTGKSELPRLYSHFGGINFLSLPVQPNWDSQEAMLGYFNSIDNRFDAQDVLRLLDQTQRDPGDSNGLNDVLTLILLDEMNLANVELYFSDFLSKLETRRGLSDADVPTIGVKIGTGLEDYKIKLGRNVLWTGTMNQDETTRTLSDKVLDRGVILNFPRPTNLERRIKSLKLKGHTPLLPRTVWTEWVEESRTVYEKPNFNDTIMNYKNTIQDINSHLERTGRALGHRVFQSIEAYISHHPHVIEACKQGDDTELHKHMKTAFEDQLVQKVMPKLRGIETRGVQGKALESIQRLLEDNEFDLHDDFENAKEFGYGQFMWCSSNYLREEE